MTTPSTHRDRHPAVLRRRPAINHPPGPLDPGLLRQRDQLEGAVWLLGTIQLLQLVAILALAAKVGA